MNHEVSLIIATRNRCQHLARTLNSLRRLDTGLSWELVIADNGSTDDTQKVVEEFGAEFPHPVRLVYEPKRGLGNAHNAGWRAASAPIVTFTDDDCYPAHDYLDAVVRCFAEDPSLGFVGGRILLYDETDLRVTVQESAIRRSFSPGSFIRPGDIHGANFACKREAIEEVNGFDPWFGPGAFYNAEEVDLLARLSAKGWNGAYDPRPLVYHHHGRKTAADWNNLMLSYDRGRGAYYTKCIFDPELRSTYLKSWYRELRRNGYRTAIRELSSGMTFFLREVFDRSRRFS